MDDDEIVALVRGNESDRVERKESLTERVREAICAFANDLAGHQRPAVVVIGQRDDRSCANLSIDVRLLTTLAGMRVESSFAPFPSIDVRALMVDGCHVAAIVVHPSSSPPVRYAGRIWVRVGPTRRVATPEEERRLTERRRAGNLPFDVQPVSTATLADLDLDHFTNAYLPNAVAPDVLEENHRERVQQLAALRMVTPDGIPTVVGMHRTYESTNAPVRISWFSDRIEVLSPGGPYGQVTIEQFGRPGLTDYRNPHIAEALKVLGFVERFGIGLQLANRRLRENENPEFEYEPEHNYVLVRLRRGG